MKRLDINGNKKTKAIKKKEEFQGIIRLIQRGNMKLAQSALEEYLEKYKEIGNEVENVIIIYYELKETKENILLAMELDNGVKSMDEEISDDGKENTLYNQIKVESYEDETIKKMILKDEISRLNEKEMNIIILRYFYNKSQKEVAANYGISQVQISRIEKKILLKMRENIKEKI